jgi:predicted nucleic acid-binding protein
MLAQSSSIVIMSDTNAAYKLYFFAVKEVIPFYNIQIGGVGVLEFHPIVLEELTAHLEAHRILSDYGWTDETFPKFFDSLNENQKLQLTNFVSSNVSKTITSVSSSDSDFHTSRKAYEKERVNLQNIWKSNGTQGRKVFSKPTLNDYKVLFSAQECNYKLLTNDEILLAVAESILDEGFTYKTEDIINAALKLDPSKKQIVEEVLDNLSLIGEAIIRSRIFSGI